jgi:5'-3' exonuclease
VSRLDEIESEYTVQACKKGGFRFPISAFKEKLRKYRKCNKINEVYIATDSEAFIQMVSEKTHTHSMHCESQFSTT